MKLKFLLVFIFLAISPDLLFGYQQITYMGTIEFPSIIDEHEQKLSLYYKGKYIDTEDATYFFLNERLHKLYILVTDPLNIKPHAPEENNIVYQKLRDKSIYQLFEIYLIAAPNNTKTYSWYVKECSLAKDADTDCYIIPLDTIIVPLTPHIVSLQKSEFKQAANLIKLPTIVITCDNKETLQEQLRNSSIGCINLKPFHAPEKLKQIKQDNLIVAMRS